MMRPLVVALLVVGAVACGDDDDSTEGDGAGDTTDGGAGEDGTEPVDADEDGAEITVTSPVFAEGESIPARFTCDGDDVSPPLEWTGVPEDTEELALIVDDPDAPGGTFVHWTLWALDAAAPGLPEGEVPDLVTEGATDFGEAGWNGPCPPEGDEPHRYVFTVLALSEPLELDDEASADDFEQAIEDIVLAEGHLTGRYGR